MSLLPALISRRSAAAVGVWLGCALAACGAADGEATDRTRAAPTFGQEERPILTIDATRGAAAIATGATIPASVAATPGASAGAIETGLADDAVPRTVRLGGEGRVFPSDIAWVGDAYAVVYSDTPIGQRGRLRFMRVSAAGEVLAERDLGFGNRAQLAFNGTEIGVSYSDQRPGWGVRFMRLTPDGEQVPGSDIGLSEGTADHAHVAYNPRDRRWVVMWGQYRPPNWEVMGVFLGDDGRPRQTRRLAQGTGGFRFVANVVWGGDRFAATLTPNAELVELTEAGVSRRTPLEFGWPGGSVSAAWDARGIVVAHSLRPNIVAVSRVVGGQVARLGVIEEGENRFVNGATVHPVPGGFFVVWEAHTSATTDSRLHFSRYGADDAPITAASGRLVADEGYQSFHRIAPWGRGITVLHSVGHYNGRPRAFMTSVPALAPSATGGPAPMRAGGQELHAPPQPPPAVAAPEPPPAPGPPANPPRRGRVLLGQPGHGAIFGRFHSREVVRMARRARAALHRCYDERLAERPDLAGDLEVAFVIQPPGRVTVVRFRGDTVRDAPLRACVEPIFRRFRWPQGPSRPVLVRYPLTFRPVP